MNTRSHNTQSLSQKVLTALNLKAYKNHSSKEISKKLALILGLPKINLDNSRLISVEINNTMIHFEVRGSMVILHTVFHVLKVSDRDNSQALKKLLHANLFWNDLGGANFSYEPADGSIFFSNVFVAENRSADHIERVIQSFMNALKFWRSQISFNRSSLQPSPSLTPGVHSFI